MQTVRGETENDVAEFDSSAVDDFWTINHTDNATGEIVFAFAIHSRHLRGLTADQCAASSASCARKSTEKLIVNSRLKFFATDVIEKKKRPRAEHGDVVHAVIHQIGADGVMFVQRKRNFQLGAHAIDARNQDRLPHVGEIWAE